MDIRKECTLIRDRTRWGKLDLLVTMLFVIGLALNAWGVVANGLVCEMNGGVMPVFMTDSPLAVLAEEDRHNHRIVDEGQMIPASDRLGQEIRLAALSDWIKIDFPDLTASVPKDHLGKMVRWWAKWLDYPLEGGVNMVSIGDLMRWSGTACFLLLFVLLIPLIVRRIASGDVPRVLQR